MNQRQLTQEIHSLQKLLETASVSLNSAPEGRLHCSMQKGKYPQYYLVDENAFSKHPTRSFVKREELDKARQLAQKEYDQKMISVIQKQLKSLQNFQQGYEPNACLSVYDHLPPAKKLLVTPYLLPDEDFLVSWYAQHIPEGNPYPIENGFITEQGELVRSKTEKIIADKLFYKGIPYRYEAPLILNSSKIIYPDFTLLNRRTRKTLYFEHFGLMDNPEYCKKALEKIDLYERNGIYQGDSLLFTMESSTKVISTQILDSTIQRYLK